MEGQREGRSWGRRGSCAHPRLVRGGVGWVMQPRPLPQLPEASLHPRPSPLVTSRECLAPPVTSRSGPGVFSGFARGRSSPWRVRRGAHMKKVASKQSPPKLFGGCALRREALVAMDAAATNGGRARAGSPGGVTKGQVILGPRDVGPRSRPRRHHEVSKEGISPQNTKQILRDHRELERSALAALGTKETLTGAGVLG